PWRDSSAYEIAPNRAPARTPRAAGVCLRAYVGSCDGGSVRPPDLASAAHHFSAVHGGVDRFEQRIEIRAVLRRESDPYRHTQACASASGSRHRRLQAPGDNRGVLETGLGQNNHELIPAETRHDVRTSHLRRDPARHLLQYTITGVVSVCVVYRLEPVEIGEQHRKRRALNGQGTEQGAGALLQSAAVQQTG